MKTCDRAVAIRLDANELIRALVDSTHTLYSPLSSLSAPARPATRNRAFAIAPPLASSTAPYRRDAHVAELEHELIGLRLRIGGDDLEVRRLACPPTSALTLKRAPAAVRNRTLPSAPVFTSASCWSMSKFASSASRTIAPSTGLPANTTLPAILRGLTSSCASHVGTSSRRCDAAPPPGGALHRRHRSLRRRRQPLRLVVATLLARHEKRVNSSTAMDTRHRRFLHGSSLRCRSCRITPNDGRMLRRARLGRARSRRHRHQPHPPVVRSRSRRRHRARDQRGRHDADHHRHERAATASAQPRSRASARQRRFATAGVHPHHAKDCDASTIDTLRALARRPEVVAIGECGLDFNRDFSPRDVQERWFEAQLELAAEVALPVFLHERDAARPHARDPRQAPARSSPAVSSTASPARRATVERYLALDLHIGITGWICDERRGASLRRGRALDPARSA